MHMYEYERPGMSSHKDEQKKKQKKEHLAYKRP